MERRTKVFIVDDHPILCEMVASMLSGDPSFEVVGAASSIRETLAAVGVRGGTCGPDLMLIDLTLKDGSGIQLVRTLRSRGINARVLVLTGIRNQGVAAEAFSVGAVGYVLKEQSPADLRAAIDAVVGGGNVHRTQRRNVAGRFLCGLGHHESPGMRFQTGIPEDQSRAID